jgi:hypothetical protein
MMKDEVIVIRGDKVVRVSAAAFQDVMTAADQMHDDWFDHAKLIGVKPGRAKAGFDALRKLFALSIGVQK